MDEAAAVITDQEAATERLDGFALRNQEPLESLAGIMKLGNQIGIETAGSVKELTALTAEAAPARGRPAGPGGLAKAAAGCLAAQPLWHHRLLDGLTLLAAGDDEGRLVIGPGTINDVLGAIATQVTTAITKLVPVGQALTGSFVALSILMLGAALVSGGSSFIAPIVRMTAAAAGTFWAISHWPEITTGTLQGARAAIGLLTGGYDGPATLFQMANDVSARVFTETNGLSMWSFSTYVEAVVSGLAGILIWLGLTVTGLLAILAEFQLLIGAAVAPLILPALAFGFTTPIGWGRSPSWSRPGCGSWSWAR